MIPIVLYYGEARWTAVQEVAELVEAFHPEANSFRPRLSYWLIDEGSYDLGELEGQNNVAARLFWLERMRAEEDFGSGIERLAELVTGSEDGEVRAALASYVDHVLFPARGHVLDDSPREMGLKEFRDMLADRVEVWSKDLLERGRREGEAKLLLRQLERKFGTLDSGTRERVESAGPSQLLAWGERVLEAGRIEDVFEG